MLPIERLGSRSGERRFQCRRWARRNALAILGVGISIKMPQPPLDANHPILGPLLSLVLRVKRDRLLYGGR